MPLIDLTKPHFIAEYAAKPYVQQYERILEIQAAGGDIRRFAPVEGMEQVMPKALDAGARNHLATGQLDRWGGPEFYQWAFSDGVATIDMIGPIVRYGGMLSALSGITSTESIIGQMSEALNHPQVQSVILNSDSPGGECTSLIEASDLIRQSRNSGKPIVAYADGSCCSAAYLLASACDYIVASPGAVVGSVGAVFSVVDDSEKQAKEGVTVRKYYSSVSPDKGGSDDKYQKLVNDHGDLIVGAVAENRGIPVEKVLANYGQGGVFVGKQALKAGMVDHIGDYKSLVDALATGRGPKQTVAKRIGGVMSLFKNGTQAQDAQEPGELVAGIAQPVISLEEFEALKAQNAALVQQSTEFKALADGIAAEKRDGAITSFLAAATPKVNPAALDSVKAMAEASYDGKVIPMATLAAFFENMPVNGFAGKVDAAEAIIKTNPAPNPEDAKDPNAVDEAAVAAGLAASGIPIRKEIK